MADAPKILVVDDDPLIIKLVEKLLVHSGFKIITAANGESGLQKVREEEPDLVILDVNMPKIDGLEVCRRLKRSEQTRLIPVILLTSQDYVDDKITGLKTGADDYITKPFNTKEFVARVKGMIDKSVYQHKRAEREKLEALENMAEEVAHEVRNPVTAIGGLAKRLRDRLPAGGTLRTYADHILREAARLEVMVDEIVKLKTLVVSPHERIDVQHLLDAALNCYAALLKERKIQVVKKHPSALPYIRVDRKNLKACFCHIIENAIEAIESSGSITVETSSDTKQMYIHFSDTGRGIAKNEIAQVIRPFYTSKMSGAGMGLTTVRHIVALHGGELTITSTRGTGTRVTIVLPLPDEPCQKKACLQN